MFRISPQANKALQLLNKAGFEAYIVGGTVRNYLTGQPESDIDITTNATPQQIMAVFDDYHIIETGLQHGTVTVHIDHIPIEITTYRTESTYSDNRHPDKVEFTTSLREDCARRDFTMNTICYNPSVGLVDFYGGEKDIENRLIRCIGDPDARFKEDALRILRAVRFASVLGFDIESETQSALFRNAHLLKNVSAERIYVELNKLLCGKNVKEVLLKYTEILAVFIPEIMPLKNFQQHNPHHIYDVLQHTAVAVENLPPQPHLRMAALLHDFGKPHTFTMDEKGTGHFYGHGEISRQMTKEILHRLKASNDDIYTIHHLVKYHDTQIIPEEKAVRRALNKHGEQGLRDLILLKRADNAGQNTKDFDRTAEYDTLEKMVNYVIEKQQCYSLNQLAINGRDLINMGIPPSAEIGRILNELLQLVINGDLPNEKLPLLQKAKELAGK